MLGDYGTCIMKGTITDSTVMQDGSSELWVPTFYIYYLYANLPVHCSILDLEN